MSRVRAVTLDAGGTLLAPWPSVGVVYADCLRSEGIAGVDPTILEDRFRCAWRERVNFDYSRGAWLHLVTRVLEGWVHPGDIEPLFGRIWHRFTEPEVWRIYPDVLPGLERLRASGVRMAVVSNWDTRLHELMRGLGLTPWFEFVLPSVEAPAPKPDSGIFRLAAGRFGLDPGSILHVGDSRNEDVVGARKAGFRSIWLQRDPFRDADPDLPVIGSLEDLVDHLDGRGRRETMDCGDR